MSLLSRLSRASEEEVPRVAAAAASEEAAKAPQVLARQVSDLFDPKWATVFMTEW